MPDEHPQLLTATGEPSKPGQPRRVGKGVYFSDSVCLEHDPTMQSPGHPDAPERLLAIERLLAEHDWLGWERRASPPALQSMLEMIHHTAHIENIKEIALAGGGVIDSDTFIGPSTYNAALHAAGGACEMAKTLMAGEADFGFCGVRPPGHHAEPGRAMGFCMFNNIAIAAEFAISELDARRVFILDWDVHHGNATAEAFRHRPDVLFASIHQSPFYPGTGGLGDAGSGAGEGYTINLPVPAGSDEGLWLSLIEHIVLPAATQFEPDLVLVSAGFDAHREDPLGNCRLQTGSFVEMARHVRDFAVRLGVPIGAVLEGGYQPAVLGQCVKATLDALRGTEPARSVTPEMPLTSRAATDVGRYWPL